MDKPRNCASDLGTIANLLERQLIRDTMLIEGAILKGIHGSSGFGICEPDITNFLKTDLLGNRLPYP